MESKQYPRSTWQIITFLVSGVALLPLIAAVWMLSTAMIGNIIATVAIVFVSGILFGLGSVKLKQRNYIIKRIIDEWDLLLIVNEANLTKEDIEKIKQINHDILNETREQLLNSVTFNSWCKGWKIEFNEKKQKEALSPLTFCRIHPYKTIEYKDKLYHGLAHGQTIDIEWTGDIDVFIGLMKHELAHLYVFECKMLGEENHHYIFGQVGL